MDCLALDIGGANLKVADGLGYAATRRFPLWRKPDALGEALRQCLAAAPAATVLAVISYFLIRRLTVTYRKKLHSWQEKHGHKHPSDRSKDDETTDTPAAADEETPRDA